MTLDAMQTGLLIVAAALAWEVARLSVQRAFKGTIGTRYRKASECANCATKRDVAVLRVLVVELAIKAGVPAHEVAKMATVSPGDCK